MFSWAESCAISVIGAKPMYYVLGFSLCVCVCVCVSARESEMGYLCGKDSTENLLFLLSQAACVSS